MKFTTAFVDVYDNGHHIKRTKIKVELVKSFKTMEWEVTNSAIQEAIKQKFPYLSSQPNITFEVS